MNKSFLITGTLVLFLSTGIHFPGVSSELATQAQDEGSTAGQTVPSTETERAVEEGKRLTYSNQYEEAIKSFDRAISLDPSSADAYYWRGNALDYISQHERAFQDYEQAIRLDVYQILKHKTRLPRFKDYPVSEVYHGKPAPAVIKTHWEKMYRTRLREAAREKPNFAGHYVLTDWGCGADCRQIAIIDSKTGNAYWAPFGLFQQPPFPDLPGNFDFILCRPDSTLVIFLGGRKEGDPNGIHYYKFEHNGFVLLRSINRPEKAPE